MEANVFTTGWDFAHAGASAAAVGRRAGAERLGATVYELLPGARWADLHVHYANEELIVVLAGTPTLHMLEGSRRLERGDVVACLRGRRGAHRLENASDEVARVLIVSTMVMPEVVEYPERPNGGGVFVMTEPPFTGAPLDESRGRILRVFERDAGFPVPPDEGPKPGD
ncbi:MAG: cupin domain-containing protein [Thermoleophilia bacterium]|nr:cupin domain-containing protein [Thermoleophilia bacterium]